MDNRFLIANLISCAPDAPRVIGDYDLFAIQEKVIQDILTSVQNQQAMEAAPKTVPEIQAAVTPILQKFLNSPTVKREDAVAALKFLNIPMSPVQVKALRHLFRDFQKSQDGPALIGGILALREQYGERAPENGASRRRTLSGEDLRLMCFDYLCS